MKTIAALSVITFVLLSNTLWGQEIAESLPEQSVEHPAVTVRPVSPDQAVTADAVCVPSVDVEVDARTETAPSQGVDYADLHILPGVMEPVVSGYSIPDFDETLVPSDTITGDFPAETRKPKLLPDNMSFMERGLWGENGFFRNIGIASPLTPEVRKHELGVRRTMLVMHQIGGFVTLASMYATVFYGQRYLNNGDRNDRSMHQTFVATTIATYAATGLLSVLSPPPLIRRDEMSTTTIHKTLAWLHFAGMIVTPILGAAINRRGSSYYQQAHFHQVAAYITTSIFTASMVVILF